MSTADVPRLIGSRVPPKARCLFQLAAILTCVAALLIAEGLWFRARATRVEGTVVAHDNRGRPVVAYRWGRHNRRHDERGPIEPLPVGAKVGVYVPPEGPPAVRLDWPIGLLFLPGWACLMPAAFLAAYGLAVSIDGRQPEAKPVAAPDLDDFA